MGQLLIVQQLPSLSAESIIELFRHVYTIGKHWEHRWSPAPMRLWFRGVDDGRFSLDPGLLRAPYVGGDLEQAESDISSDFRVRGRPYFPSPPQSGWEEMFLMQHYGFPTRLLDWSESLATAAYFAARDIDSSVDGAVWVMSPQFLTHRAQGEYATHVATTHSWLRPYEQCVSRRNLEEFNKLVPLPLLPDHFDTRIVAQRGRFTVHTFALGSLSTLAKEDRQQYGDACFLHQIRIPVEAKSTIRQQALIVGGASEDTLFPDLEGLSRSMRWEAREQAKKPA